MEPGKQSLIPGSKDQRSTRFTSREKTQAVLRLLRGESIETISLDLGVSASRIERWSESFLEAGSAELGKRRDLPSKNWPVQDWDSIRQWLWLLLALIAVISILVVFLQRAPQQ
jgi:hypothetical protein